MLSEKQHVKHLKEERKEGGTSQTLQIVQTHLFGLHVFFTLQSISDLIYLIKFIEE